MLNVKGIAKLTESCALLKMQNLDVCSKRKSQKVRLLGHADRRAYEVHESKGGKCTIRVYAA